MKDKNSTKKLKKSSTKRLNSNGNNPNGWNPYPSVTPPSEGDWLVQDKYGDLTIREFHVTYGPEGCDKWWENTPSYYPEAVAFRALPEPYTGNKK